MLETEEVDDDYFTPVASASLSNIFGKSSVMEAKSENESLKYTPPKPQNVSKQPEDSKASSCAFACVLVAYEWLNNTYLQKGKLGFALIKVLKTETHNMVLYDSNKTTLSSVIVSSKTKVTLKSTNYISYYDDQRKYWSLYGAQNEIKTITELLKSLDVTIDTSTETDINPPEPKTIKEVQPLQEDTTKPVESDTDTSVHRKAKVSILNRMANMGHSVLPTNAVPFNKTSDSSDTNETDYHIKAVRHKPVKGTIKKNLVDKPLVDYKKIIDVHPSAETPRFGKNITDFKNISSFTNDQLVPLVNTGIINSPNGNDMNVFITEQRISNTELRINMGRMSDKIEHLLSKVNLLEMKNQNEGTADINTEILLKLVREYETKIKSYEELFKKMGTDINPQNMTISLNDKSTLSYNDDETLKNRAKELEQTTKENDDKILRLQNEIQNLKEAKDTEISHLETNIYQLEVELSLKQNLLKDLTEENNLLNKTNVENKIKSLMNDTYQAVATNFENGETYSSESIKKIIAMVIKKVTISALNDL